MKDVDIPASFLPGHGLNGNRQMKPFSVLLKKMDAGYQQPGLLQEDLEISGIFHLSDFERRWTFENCSEYRY